MTGEEDEQNLWAGEGTLYEFDQTWKERGKGELRINRGQGRAARFVMRQKGHHRLLMNANLWAEMKATPMDGGKVGASASINTSYARTAEPVLPEAADKIQTIMHETQGLLPYASHSRPIFPLPTWTRKTATRTQDLH